MSRSGDQNRWIRQLARDDGGGCACAWVSCRRIHRCSRGKTGRRSPRSRHDSPVYEDSSRRAPGWDGTRHVCPNWPGPSLRATQVIRRPQKPPPELTRNARAARRAHSATARSGHQRRQVHEDEESRECPARAFILIHIRIEVFSAAHSGRSRWDWGDDQD